MREKGIKSMCKKTYKRIKKPETAMNRLAYHNTTPEEKEYYLNIINNGGSVSEIIWTLKYSKKSITHEDTVMLKKSLIDKLITEINNRNYFMKSSANRLSKIVPVEDLTINDAYSYLYIIDKTLLEPLQQTQTYDYIYNNIDILYSLFSGDKYACSFGQMEELVKSYISIPSYTRDNQDEYKELMKRYIDICQDGKCFKAFNNNKIASSLVLIDTYENNYDKFIILLAAALRNDFIGISSLIYIFSIVSKDLCNSIIDMLIDIKSILLEGIMDNIKNYPFNIFEAKLSKDKIELIKSYEVFLKMNNSNI